MRKQWRQCAALPFRDTGDETEVMLITSRDTGRWILPKGWVEKDLPDGELARKEAFEEAGLLGDVGPFPIYKYSYMKRLPDQAVECSVKVFPLRVTALLDDWPEAHQRRREWFTVGQAALLIDDADLVTLLLSLTVPHALDRLVPQAA